MTGITYKFSVAEVFLIRDGADGVRDLVSEARWELVGTHESGITAMRYGTEPLGDRAKHAVDKHMTPEVVAGWVQEALANSVMADMKKDIEARIMAQVNSGKYRVMAPWKVKAPAAGEMDVQPEDTALL